MIPGNPWRALTILIIALPLVTCGCGKKGKEWTFNDQVEGVVKLEGAPVANVFVQFVPDDPEEQGPISRGITDAKGHFRLATDDERDGAVIGKHRILVFAGRTDTGARAGGNVPPSYRNVKDTKLTLDVTPDKHSYDVDLKR
jgi:hypothetical protein